MPKSSKKRLLLDTNIYGLLIEKGDARKMLEERGVLDIYGNEIVRKELRNVPKNIRHKNRNFRIMLLTLYDGIIKDSLKVTNFVEELANQYFEILQSMQISIRKEIMNDLLIVATASVYELDIVVSDDRKTMLSPNALKAYDVVNRIRNLRMPNFIGYNDFRRLLSHE